MCLVTAIAGYILVTPPAQPEPEPPLPMAPLPHYERVEPLPELKLEKPLEPKLKEEPLPPGVKCLDDCPLIEKEVREFYADVPVLAEIARCESHFRHYDENGEVLRNKQGSSATGVMQIMASVHGKEANVLGYDLEDLTGNMAYARHLYETQGTTPWNASIYCWSGLARL